MNWCIKCVLPDTRPNLKILDDGVCNACKLHKIKKETKNWSKQKKKLEKIFEIVKNKNKNNYDCVIPVSGGKDSTWQVIECLRYNLTPLAVTRKSPGRIKIGKKNLDNLISLGVDHIDYSINPKVEAYFMLKTLKIKGSSAIPMHFFIYNIPRMIAEKFNIPLVIWGENSAAEYGFKKKKDLNSTMNKEWLKNYAPTGNTDLNFWIDKFLNKKKLVSLIHKNNSKIKSIFLGDYLKWDPQKSFNFAKRNGFLIPKAPKTGYYNFADIDCDFISIHHYIKWLKFGFTRLFDNLSLEIRNNRMTRKEAITIIKKHSKKIKPEDDIKKFCKFTKIELNEFDMIVEKFRNKKIWKLQKNKWYIEDFITKGFNW